MKQVVKFDGHFAIWESRDMWKAVSPT